MAKEYSLNIESIKKSDYLCSRNSLVYQDIFNCHRLGMYFRYVPRHLFYGSKEVARFASHLRHILRRKMPYSYL